MNKVILYLSLAGAAFAISPPVEKPGDNVTTPRYATGLSKPSPSKEFVTAFEAGVRYGLISYIGDPTDDDIPSLTKKAKVLYFQIVVDEGKQLIADANDGTTSALSERGIIITNQEASDVVKALEILMPGVPEVYEKSEGASGYGATMTCPSYQKGMSATREQIDKGFKDLAWARAVLETWRAKVKGAK